MHERQLYRPRVVASIAATIIGLAAGTNYVYSAWAPQFADRLKLSATESNLVGLAGNLGMYTFGLPIGIFIDTRGPRLAILAGAALLGLGYYWLHQAFERASEPVALLCLWSYITGLGGCMTFLAAIKVSALNWPHHRGTATGFPLAAFGLSAFCFSVFGSLFFPGNTGAFLETLAWGSSGLTFAGFFFIRVLPPGASNDHDHASTSAAAVSPRHSLAEPGMSSAASNASGSIRDEEHAAMLDGLEEGESDALVGNTLALVPRPESPVPPNGLAKQESDNVSWKSLGSQRGDLSGPAQGEVPGSSGLDEDSASEASSLLSPLPPTVLEDHNIDVRLARKVDIRGFQLLAHADFWRLWFIMGILAGVGLMTINNIGNNATALWRHYDPSIDDAFLLSRHQMHVSILSVCSFSGRLLSGLGSDLLTKVLHANRVWCLVAGGLIFLMVQICALGLSDPHFLGLVSGFSGLGYGFVFGVLPSIVAETFGVHGLSQNWGMMILSPVASGYVFNLFYGSVYDRHSTVGPDGDRTCFDGIDCYRSAYISTSVACCFGLGLTLWVIAHQNRQRTAEMVKPRD